MRVHPTVTASTMIARFYSGRKVRCHKTGVEIDLSQGSHTAANQIFGRRVELLPQVSHVILVAFRDEDDHPLPRAREQHPIRVLSVNSLLGVLYPAPLGFPPMAQGAQLPTFRLVPNEIAAPAEADPVQLQTLNLKFCCEHLAPKARTNVGFVG
jgi:hypothetical protein